jgi:hypothetical protein
MAFSRLSYSTLVSCEQVCALLCLIYMLSIDVSAAPVQIAPPCQQQLISYSDSCGLSAGCTLTAWALTNGEMVFEGQFNGTLQVIRTSYPPSVEYIEITPPSKSTTLEILHYLPLAAGYYADQRGYQPSNYVVIPLQRYSDLRAECIQYNYTTVVAGQTAPRRFYNKDYAFGSLLAPPSYSNRHSINTLTFLNAVDKPDVQAFWFLNLSPASREIVYDCVMNVEAGDTVQLKRVSVTVPCMPTNVPLQRSDYWRPVDSACVMHTWQDVFIVSIQSG